MKINLMLMFDNMQVTCLTTMAESVLQHETISEEERNITQQKLNKEKEDHLKKLDVAFEQRLTRLEQHFVSRRNELAQHYAELQSKWKTEEDDLAS
jgi:hypothetical protein